MMIQNKRILTAALFVLISISCYAVDPGDLPPPGTPPGPGLPIDAGVIIGLVVGLFYGGKKMLKK
ncbi:MAG: hypothetical protein ACON5F_05105 [Jejuia sp.]